MDERRSLLGEVRQRRRRSPRVTVALVLAATSVGLITLGVTLGVTLSKKDPQETIAVQSNDKEFGTKGNIGIYRNGGVASDHQECSSIGRKVLDEWKGSSVDAAIAVNLCDGIHNAQSMGIGGGSLMVVFDVPRHQTEKVLMTFDSRETAPRAATWNMLLSNQTSAGLLTGLPGDLAGAYEAWRMFGRLPWKKLFQPAIYLCKKGYRLSDTLAKKIQSSLGDKMDPSFYSIYRHPDGSLPEAGDTLYRPELGITLEKIAKEGPDSFYRGELAKTIVAEIQAIGGLITKQDLQDYQVKISSPMEHSLPGKRRLVFPRLPSSGVVMAFMLNVLIASNVTNKSFKSGDGYHVLAETYKFAFAERLKLGDEDFVNVSQVIVDLLSADYASAISQKLDHNRTREPEFYGATRAPPEDHGTAQYSIVAPNGGATSMTSTINRSFGCKRRGQYTGIIYNDEMADFGVPNEDSMVTEDLPNVLAPGKRPLSSMCPSIVLNDRDEVELVLGTAGGTRITTVNAFVAMEHLLFGKPLQEAMDTPRIHHQLFPNSLQYEKPLSQDIVKALQIKGHKTVLEDEPIGFTQGVSVQYTDEGKKITAVSDKRKTSGGPDGF